MIQTAPIFTDHMVLQRDKNVAVFGTGTAGESVRVSLPAQNRTVSGCVGGDGTWCVYLPPLTAGTGMTLEVAGAENQLVYTDVAVGEVWLAGGQSNMEFMLKDAKGGAEALQHCAESGVRCFRVPRNTFPDAAYAQEFAESRWELATPETAGVWSAVAYWAAQKLAQRLGVPVGIVGCNYGGSSVSCWMSEEDLERHAAGHPYLKDYQDAVAGKTDAEMIAAYDDYLVYHAAWTERMEKCYQEDGNMKWDEVIRRAGPAPWASKARFVPPVCTASCCAGSCRTPFGDSGIIRGRTTTFGQKRMPRCSAP